MIVPRQALGLMMHQFLNNYLTTSNDVPLADISLLADMCPSQVNPENTKLRLAGVEKVDTLAQNFDLRTMPLEPTPPSIIELPLGGSYTASSSRHGSMSGGSGNTPESFVQGQGQHAQGTSQGVVFGRGDYYALNGLGYMPTEGKTDGFEGVDYGVGMTNNRSDQDSVMLSGGDGGGYMRREMATSWNPSPPSMNEMSRTTGVGVIESVESSVEGRLGGAWSWGEVDTSWHLKNK